MPTEVRVEADSGWPVAVIERGVRQTVESVEDLWRIEDEWWRQARISRTYFEVLLQDGRRVSIYHDHVSEAWYRQRHA
jgi:hypothetical protein